MTRRIQSTRAPRGSALVEFSLGFGLLITTLAGVYQLGYAFYLYNMLESAVRDGARFASLAPYDAPDGARFTERVRNMVVYGNPDPPASAAPLVPDLTAANVTVAPTFDSRGVPQRVAVQIDNFPIQALFAAYTLEHKPRCSFPYMGWFEGTCTRDDAGALWWRAP